MSPAADAAAGAAAQLLVEEVAGAAPWLFAQLLDPLVAMLVRCWALLCTLCEEPQRLPGQSLQALLRELGAGCF